MPEPRLTYPAYRVLEHADCGLVRRPAGTSGPAVVWQLSSGESVTRTVRALLLRGLLATGYGSRAVLTVRGRAALEAYRSRAARPAVAVVRAAERMTREAAERLPRH